jgi:hypothetical protein
VGLAYWWLGGTKRPLVAGYVIFAGALLFAGALTLPRGSSFALRGTGIAMIGALSQTSPTPFGLGLAAATITAVLGMLPDLHASVRDRRTQMAVGGVLVGLALFAMLWRYYT